MVASTVIPKAMLNTKMVLGFNGILKYPIVPAVIINGMMLGMIAMIIILIDGNKKPIVNEINNNDQKVADTKLSNKYEFPFKKIAVVPVIFTLY